MPSRSSYLLTDIPEELRTALSEEAAELNQSVAAVVRAALAAHYGIEIPTRRRRFNAWLTSDRMVIRATSELFTAVRRDAEERGTTMKDVIIDILESHVAAPLGT